MRMELDYLYHDISGDITISGAASLVFSSNLVGVVLPTALRISNAKHVSIEGNLFELTAQPRRAVAEINLAKSTSLEDDYARCLVSASSSCEKDLRSSC